MIYYGDYLSSLSRARVQGGFPYSVEHMAGGGQPVQAACQCYTRIQSMCSLSMCPSLNYGGVFMRDSGCSLSFSYHLHYVCCQFLWVQPEKFCA